MRIYKEDIWTISLIRKSHLFPQFSLLFLIHSSQSSLVLPVQPVIPNSHHHNHKAQGRQGSNDTDLPRNISRSLLLLKRLCAQDDAFQASNSINAAPNVPVKKEAASSPALFLGIPFGSRPIIRPAPRMVGSTHINITMDLSRHLSDNHPTKSTQHAPTAPEGVLRIRACWEV